MKTARYLFVFVVVIVFLMAACDVQTPEPAPVVEQPQEPASPSEPQAAAPAEPAVPAQPQYAPFCEAAAPSGCTAPTVTMVDPKYCVEKVPYVIISVPPGTTYQSTDPDMECVDQIHSDGNLRVTCHSISSKDDWSYDLQLCNGACSAPALQMGTDQCPEGYGYDTANTCCAAPAPATGGGCTTFKVDLHVCFGE